MHWVNTVVLKHLWSVCAAVPSPPQNVISSVNETSLSLEWEEPQDTGGRGDVIYNVVCKKCLREQSPCLRCNDNVDISPRRLGLTERKVVVRNLQAHTRYSFEVQAVNGVSGKNPATPRYATVNITTNQAGKYCSTVGASSGPTSSATKYHCQLVRLVSQWQHLTWPFIITINHHRTG